MSNAATRAQLNELLRQLVAILLEHFKTERERIDPEMLNVARRLLRDNGIDADDLADAQRSLAELGALTLPFR